MNINVRIIALSILICIAACTSSNALTASECEQLLNKINRIYGETLQGADREQFFSEAIITPEDITECQSDGTWNRKGYNCVMKADSKASLERCIF